MKLFCKICNVELGEMNKGKIAKSKMVILCSKCYREIIAESVKRTASYPPGFESILGLK